MFETEYSTIDCKTSTGVQALVISSIYNFSVGIMTGIRMVTEVYQAALKHSPKQGASGGM